MPKPRYRLATLGLATLTLVLLSVRGSGEGPARKTPTPEETAFFTKEVLPILQAHCFSCHGADKKIRGGLRLTSREAILEGGDTGPAVTLDKPQDSLLLQAINHQELRMPPKGKLPQAQIETLTKWVKQGVPWSAEAVEKVAKRHGAPAVDDQARAFWSFKPVTRPAVPTVQKTGWVRNPIDAFILAKLEAKGFSPAPAADKTTLLRRVHYAVTGLPPTPADVEAFLNDHSPDAYEKVVDRLLASRHYGEQWGRHWLDLVRYAETNSFERDGAKPFVWRYRDYVIRSFNQDKPYDRFIREQLAGDELDEVTPETIVATGYYRLGLWDDEPADPVLSYYDGLDDIVSTTGQAFLGLTLGCARCHDHKIDPLPQKDYYQMLAFFHGVQHYGERSEGSVMKASLRPIGIPEERERHKDQVVQHQKRVEALASEIEAIETAVAPKLMGGEKDDFKYPKNRPAILRKHVPDLVSQETLEHYQQLRRQHVELMKKAPKALDLALCVTEAGPQPKDTHILLRGNPQSKGDKVTPGFPSVLTHLFPSVPAPRPTAQTSGRRRALADWIADPRNPLTTRVIANRVWQHHFGRGLVRSSSNFGYGGTPPTHPELLDWLASEFVAGGMHFKPLHRMILTSAAFRMSSQGSAEATAKDPENDLLAHFDLRRLTAEEIRDSLLAVSGNLNLQKMEGPSVYPTIPPEVLAGQSQPGSGWSRSTPQEAAARSVFIHIKRSLAVPLLAVFDAADPDAPCPIRFTTTQPTQALGLLNSTFANEQAATFAADLRKQAGSDPVAQIRLALARISQRPPTTAEVERGLRFLADARKKDAIDADEALRRFCLLALNLNEFVYLD